MRKILLILTAVGLAFTLAANANAYPVNLVQNGDFETVDYRLGNVNSLYLNLLGPGQWDVYDAIPGWDSGARDAGIEVQYSGVVVPAHSGTHYIELDSHPYPSNSSMAQQILFTGGNVILEFYYRPRTSTENDNGISVYFNGVLVDRVNEVSSGTTDWELFSYNLGYYDAGTYELKFAADGIENTLGGFIDDVYLGADKINTPIPGTVWMLGAGLVGLFGLRRKIKI